MIDDIVSEGNLFFDEENYNDAIYLYELVQRFEPKKPFFTLKVQLAKAYKKVNDPDKSIKVYEDLMTREYTTSRRTRTSARSRPWYPQEAALSA